MTEASSDGTRCLTTQSRALLELMTAYETVVPGSSRNSLETDFVQESQINRENIW